MANNRIVYGVEIKGNASGVIGAVNQAVSAFQKLDGKLKSMANRAINAQINQPLGKVGDLGNSKEVAQWQQSQEMNLLRLRMENAKKEWESKRQAARAYYDELRKKQAELDALKAQRAKAVKNKKSTADIDKKIKPVQDDVDARRLALKNKYIPQMQAAEGRLQNTVAAYAKRQAQIWKETYAEQEKAAKKAADKQAQEARRAESEMRGAGRRIGSELMGSFNKLTSSATSAFNAFRLITQGFTELARTVTMFVAVPIAGFFFKAFTAATDFETAMVRVDKTTNGMKGKLGELNQWIREFALTTTSSQSELATFAEQLGQVGVDEIKPMKMLIRTVEMMATATDLSAADVTKAIGRIGTAFGYDLNTEQGARNMHRLANVINMLENTTAASAGEIVEGMLNVAATGGMLDIPIEQMAAIVAMMESMGVAADAVGNRTARFLQQVIAKPEEIAQMMQGFEATSGAIYKTGDDIMRALEKNPAALLADIAEMMSKVNTEVEGNKSAALQQWYDIFGQVGGKVGVLSGNFDALSKAMSNAITEFESGNSLFIEYDKALLTTDSHMKILRNNINHAAITLGDAFLPIINRLLEYAVPVIQILTNAFKNLKWETKLLVVGVPLLLTVLAPLLFIFSQLAHGAGMLFMGFHTVFLSFKSIAGAAGSLISVLFTAGKAVKLLSTGGAGLAAIFAGGVGPALFNIVGTIALVVAAVVGLGYAMRALSTPLKSIGVDLAGFFRGLAENMRTWGENLMVTLGNGLLAGAAKYVVQALASIAEVIASFFEAHSPPKEGPLSTIDKWGAPLFSTFLRGFYLADFGILEDIGNTIRSILSTMITGDEADQQISGIVAGAREALAQLIDTFNKTGELSQSLLDQIVAGTGYLGDEVKKLITLWLDYEGVQRRIKDLEKEKQQANKNYEDEVARIAASNLSAEEKAEKIRNALGTRNRKLTDIEKETKAEQEKAEAMKEQLDWQKAFIDAQINQSSLFAKMANAMDRAAGALEKLGNIKFGGGKPGGEGDGEEEDFKTTIQKRLEGAKEVIKAFFRGLKGELLDTELFQFLPPETVVELQKAYVLGKKIYDLFHPKADKSSGTLGGGSNKFLKALEGFGKGFGEGFSEAMKNFTILVNNPETQKALETLKGLFDDLFGPSAQGDLESTRSKWEAWGRTAGRWIGGLQVIVAGLITGLAWLINLPERIAEGFKAPFDMNEFATTLQEKLREIGTGVMLIIINGLTGGDTAWVTTLTTYLSEQIGSIADYALQWGEDLIDTYGEGLVTGAYKFIADAIAEVGLRIAAFLEPHSPPSEGPLSTIDTWGSKLIEIFANGIIEGVTTWVVGSVEKVGDKISEYLNVAGGAVSGVLSGVYDWGVGLIEIFVDGILAGVDLVGEKLSDVGERIADFLRPNSPPKEGPLSTIDTWGGRLLDLFLSGFSSGDFNPIQKIADKIGEVLSNVFGGDEKDAGGSIDIVGSLAKMLDDIIGAFTEKVPVIQAQWVLLRDMPLTVFGDSYGTTFMLPILTSLWTTLSTWFITYTPLMLQKWTQFRDTFRLAYSILPMMVATLFSGLLFDPLVVAAFDLFQSLIFERGALFARMFGDGITAVTAEVVDRMRGIVDRIVEQIDRAIAKVNDLIAALHELSAAQSSTPVPGGGPKPPKPVTPFAAGGIVTSPTMALIGEAGESEAVIPLSQLPSLMGSMMPAPSTSPIVISINNPNFADQNNMRDVLREMKKDLNEAIRDQKRMRGRG